MRRLLALALCAFTSASNALTPYELSIIQTNPAGTGFFQRFIAPLSPAPNTSGFLIYDGPTTLPQLGYIGSGLSWNGTTLSATAAAQVNSDWSSVSGISEILNKPVIVPVQRLRAQTNTAGVLTWTFPTAFRTGIIPVISLTVEDGTAGVTWNEQITAISNTSVSIQLTKTTAVTVLGISVLGVAATPQAFVHLTAIAP